MTSNFFLFSFFPFFNFFVFIFDLYCKINIYIFYILKKNYIERESRKNFYWILYLHKSLINLNSCLC